MKLKVALLILILVALGLGVALIVLNQEATKEKMTADEKATTLSKSVVAAQAQLDDERALTMTLQTNLAQTQLEFSNKLANSQSNLASVTADFAQLKETSQAAAKAASDAIAERDKKISDLQSQNSDLDKTSAELRNSITNLEEQIVLTKKLLATADGNRSFLLSEVKRLQSEKADLERKFNDLAVLKEQIHKIKKEMYATRRLDWARRGVYEASQMKGSERLFHRPEEWDKGTTNNILNVELRQDGGVTITNTPVPATR